MLSGCCFFVYNENMWANEQPQAEQKEVTLPLWARESKQQLRVGNYYYLIDMKAM